jgi:hypothetical protein
MKREGQFYVADRRLYLTSDRQRVVEHGSEDAAFLYAAVGSRIPIQFARDQGLVEEPVEEVKAAKKSPDKSAPKSADKSRTKSRSKSKKKK